MSGPTYDNRGMRFGGGAHTASKKLDHVRRARARRQVMAGYPIETAFTRPEDVWNYLNSDLITCLRCGKSYRALGNHLRIHGWTEEQYREFYGLPWRTGLTCNTTKKKQSDNALKMIADGNGLGLLDNETRISLAARARTTPHRPRAPYRKAVCVLNINKTPSHNRKKVMAGDLRIWKDADYWKIPDRMCKRDRTMTEVCNDNDLPSVSMARGFARKNAAFRGALETAHENLTFSAQARAEKLGQRFRREAAKLRGDGLTAKQIAAQLGVHRVTVERYISGIPVPEKTHCPRGHQYPPEGPKTCRICNTERKREKTGALPREIAAKILVDVPCYKCGRAARKSRLSMNRRVICHFCYQAYHKDYEKNRRNRKNRCD